jgi:F-type H+-transporting ATPase subunit b
MATTETHTETGATHGKEGGLPQLNPEHFAGQLFWLAVLFLFLYFVMSRITLPRIGAVIEGRRRRIADDLDTANRLKAQSEEAIKAHEKALGEARARGRAIAEENRMKVKAQTDKMRMQVETDLSQKLTAAEARIQDTKRQALANVRTIAGETAQAIVARLTGETVDLNEAVRAVERAQTRG